MNIRGETSVSDPISLLSLHSKKETAEAISLVANLTKGKTMVSDPFDFFRGETSVSDPFDFG